MGRGPSCRAAPRPRASLEVSRRWVALPSPQWPQLGQSHSPGGQRLVKPSAALPIPSRGPQRHGTLRRPPPLQLVPWGQALCWGRDRDAVLPSQPAAASLVASLAEVQAWPPGLVPGLPWGGLGVGRGAPSDGGGACCSPASPAQRPYDIHSSSAVESLVQLFSTVSVQYVPAWSKETVALLRKVSAHPAWSAGRWTRGAGRAAWST